MTLVDVAMAVVILGVGVVALLGFMGNATSTNRALSDNYQAVAIANAALEWGSDPANLNGSNRSTLFTGTALTHTPSVLLDARGSGLAGYSSDWTEVLTLRNVSESDLNTAVVKDSSMWEMKITVKKNNKPVLSMIRLYRLVAS